MMEGLTKERLNSMREAAREGFVSVSRCPWCINLVPEEYKKIPIKNDYRCEGCGKEFRR